VSVLSTLGVSKGAVDQKMLALATGAPAPGLCWFAGCWLRVWLTAGWQGNPEMQLAACHAGCSG